MKRIAYIILIAIALTSCTKENASNCFAGLTMRYQYVLNNQNQNLFGEVDQITAYVFDKDSLFYGSFNDFGAHLTNEYMMNVPLERGDYHIVVWGGEFDWSYSVGEMIDPASHILVPQMRKGLTKMSDFRLMIENYIAGEQQNEVYVVDKLSDLYYGYLSDVRIETNQITESKYVDLVKNTNTIKVNIDGLQYIPKTAYSPLSLIDVRCVASNGRYRYDNSIGEYARKVTYMPPVSEVSGDHMSVEMTMMRLLINDNQKLFVTDNNGETLLETDIVKSIMQNPEFTNQIDIDREDTFVFDIKIDYKLNVSVFINGWEVIEITPDL